MSTYVWNEALTTFMILSVLLVGGLVAWNIHSPFWAVMAIWGIALLAVPYLKGGQDHLAIRPRFLLFTLPFLAALMAIMFGREPFSMNDIGFTLLTGLSLFALCLASTMYLDAYTSLRMNRQFTVVLSLTSYLALITMRGPIDYYAGIAAQSAVLDNSEFMTFMVVCSIVGIILALITDRQLRKRSVVTCDANSTEGART